MKLDFEYGQGLMSANLPDNTDIFVPGETVPDPECLPQDWDSALCGNAQEHSQPDWYAAAFRAGA